MLYQEFVINHKTFRKRKLTLLQHKLRVVMKCYTIISFKLNDSTKNFTFRKSYRKMGIKFDDENINTGKYSMIELEGTDDVLVKIMVD